MNQTIDEITYDLIEDFPYYFNNKTYTEEEIENARVNYILI
jgi:hypothetical protein